VKDLLHLRQKMVKLVQLATELMMLAELKPLVELEQLAV
jgi:hypothetical protein